MNVLVVRNSPTIGGAELYYIKLADAFKKYHHACALVLLTNNKDLAQKANAHDIETHIVDIFNEEVGTKRGLVRLAMKLLAYLFRYLYTLNILRHIETIDVVLLSGTTEKLVLTPFLRLLRLPTVWLEHGRIFQSTRAKEILIAYKFMSQFASRILAEAHDTEIDLQKNNIQSSKITYLGSGVNTDHFSMTRKVFTKNFIVGFVATVCWEKGIKEFVDTVLKVSRKNRSVKFLVVGDGPQLEFAKKIIEQQSLNDMVTFVGYQESTKKYLAHMSILLSPIHHPGGLSLSIQEAMAMGVVPIVTDEGGNKELVINASTGFIISSHYPTAASRLILALAKNRSLLKSISVAARKHIMNNFSARRWAHEVYGNLSDFVPSTTSLNTSTG